MQCRIYKNKLSFIKKSSIFHVPCHKYLYEQVMQVQSFNRDDNNMEIVENELDKIINTAKRALVLAKATKRT